MIHRPQNSSLTLRSSNTKTPSKRYSKGNTKKVFKNRPRKGNAPSEGAKGAAEERPGVVWKSTRGRTEEKEWTYQEEQRLFDLHDQLGNRWTVISQHFASKYPPSHPGPITTSRTTSSPASASQSAESIRSPWPTQHLSAHSGCPSSPKLPPPATPASPARPQRPPTTLTLPSVPPFSLRTQARSTRISLRKPLQLTLTQNSKTHQGATRLW
jgi:hypothetical protein